MGDTDSSQMDRVLQRLLGTVLAGRYRIDSVLGKGGMGAVFRAHHLLLKRDMAIKVLHPRLSQNPQITERFNREAQSAARLEHPNIVRVTEFGTTDGGNQFLVMELLEGCELHTLLGHPLNPLRAAELVWQILSGLEHAHSHGVVHRDLKPENIFVTHDHRGREVLKLVDFGVAKVLGDEREGPAERSLTRAGVVFGTPAYMSPEQAMGARVDVRTDQYSVGAIFYEMLTGHPPLSHEDPVSLVRMQVSVDPPPLPTSIPEQVRVFVERLLAKNREQRFANTSDARVALERAVASLGARADISRTRTPVVNAAASWPADRSTSHGARPKSGPQHGANWLGQGALDWRHADFAENRQRSRKRKRGRWLGLTLVIATVAGAIAWNEWSRVPGSSTILAEHEKRALERQLNDGIEKVGKMARDLRSQISTEVGPTASADRSPPADTPKAGPDELEAVERALLARDAQAASEAVARLRKSYPDDPALAWRAGKAHALEGDSDAQALAEYRRAMELSPALAGDAVFAAELAALMNQPALRSAAALVALEVMGHQGHPFLLDLLNKPRPRKRELDFDLRQRIASALRRDESARAKINEAHVLSVDLRQARKTPTPCRDINRTLSAIAQLGDAALIPALEKISLPKASESSHEAELCARLPGRLAATQSALANALAREKYEKQREAADADAAAAATAAVAATHGSSDSNRRKTGTSTRGGSKRSENRSSQAKSNRAGKSRKSGKSQRAKSSKRKKTKGRQRDRS